MLAANEMENCEAELALRWSWSVLRGRSNGNRGIRRLFYLGAALEVAAIESRHLTGSALGTSRKTHRPEGGRSASRVEGERSAQQQPANSSDLPKYPPWPSYAAFSSWYTPVASARQRHDSVALEWVAHAQCGSWVSSAWRAGERLRWLAAVLGARHRERERRFFAEILLQPLTFHRTCGWYFSSSQRQATISVSTYSDFASPRGC